MDVNKSYADGTLLATLAEPGIGHLTINRPEKRNALTDQMWRAIPSALEWLVEEKGARLVIIQGAGGRDFSAGADIGEFDTLRRDAATARVYEAGNSAAFAAIRTCPVPVIALIRGICFGGGFGIAAAADIRIADETARFAIPAARLGLAYPVEAVQDLVRALGDQRARHALFSAREFPAREAMESGCLLKLCTPEALEADVNALAQSIAAVAPLSVRASKAAISAQLSTDKGLMTKAAAHADATFNSSDYAEGRTAFIEKRAPHFTGK
ncbi:enoyl-CoA hydratase-related protein [Hoeflea sp.]|uniref:enoyl-CoA hydratase-related protein n=1 Tax=Hoeflea sp. TaxID=1940281 RepID=UPI003748378F